MHQFVMVNLVKETLTVPQNLWVMKEFNRGF
jgi:hypothetical protein